MPVYVDATILGMDALSARVTNTTWQIVADSAHLVQAYSMAAAPVGVPGNSTNAPGDLRRSIIVEGPYELGKGSYRAYVGPTVIYARQRALGGIITVKQAPFLVFTVFGTTYRKTSVWQKAQPYMSPGLYAALPQIRANANARIAAAIEGA